MTTFNSYQEWATAGLLESSKIDGHPLVYPALGLAGETGEYVDKVKKLVRDGKESIDEKDLALELGDILWYLAVSAAHLGFDLESIVAMNMYKLNARHAEGKVQGSGDHR